MKATTKRRVSPKPVATEVHTPPSPPPAASSPPADLFLTPAERSKKRAHDLLDDPRCAEFGVFVLTRDGEFKTEVAANQFTLGGVAALFLRKAGALLG